MRLKQILESLKEPQLIVAEDVAIKGISANSEEIKPDFVFVAIKGNQADGHDFIKQAIEKGARVIIAQGKPNFNLAQGISWIIVKDARSALAGLATAFYGYPAKKIKVIGITGTNGKTTISYLIESLLKGQGKACAVMGTINYRLKDKITTAKNTTPGPLEIQSFLSEALKEGINYVVMEVSSHALDQQRVAGVEFSYAIFTNLTQDHLDYHGNMDNYFQAKARLFRNLSSQAVSIINLDDAYGKRLFELTKSKVISYGFAKENQIRAEDFYFSPEGAKFKLIAPEGKIEIKTKLIGSHNVYNILAAVSFALSAGMDLNFCKSSLAHFDLVPGRLEKIPSAKDFSVFVDYAHTPDALKNVITSLRQIAQNRIIVIFGCGGDRDRGKRPQMGKIATELADFVMITSDNPRSEEPMAIIEEILRGVKKDNYQVILEREAAIHQALAMAAMGDIVLIAGKGHENYQVIKERTIPFDDRRVVKNYLKK